MSLPQFMVMRSSVSGKYLRYEKGTTSQSSSLTFSHEAKRTSLSPSTIPDEIKHPNSDVVVAPESLKPLKEKITTSEKTPLEFHLLKFEAEEAKNAPGFVHIKTCYNNKYLVRKSEESKSLVAEAHEAEEDQSKWSCTMFKPIFLGEVEDDEEEGGCLYGSNKHGIGMLPQKIQLMHLAMGEEEYYVSESMEMIKKKDEEEDETTEITIFDVTASAQLPKYVTFKCRDGSKYLGTSDWYGLHFKFSDMADQGVAMVNPDSERGMTDVRILCGNQSHGGYWTPNTGDYIDLNYNKQWTFTPVKVNNYVAFYCSYQQTFLQNDPNNDNCLSILSHSISEESQLQVGEPVLSRTILSITYDVKNARVYGTTDVTKITDSRSNYTDHQDTGSLSRDFTMSRTMSWNQSITVSIGMSMSMKFGIPEVGIGGEVGLNFDISQTCTWGEENTKKETITHTYNFDVPKHTKQTKSVVASRSSCDVPFTCEVEDLLVDGTPHRYTLTDCWFTGANDYNATEETHEEPLAHA